MIYKTFKFVVALSAAFGAAFLVAAMVLFAAAESAHAVTIKPATSEAPHLIGWARVGGEKDGHIIIVSTRLCETNRHAHKAVIVRWRDEKVIHRGCWIFSPDNSKLVVAWDDGDVVTYELDRLKIFEEE